MIAHKIKTIVTHVYGLITNPNAIPAAGGCSVFITAIINIVIPTDIAPNTIKDISVVVKNCYLENK